MNFEETAQGGEPGRTEEQSVRQYQPLVRNIARGFLPRLPPSVEPDDLVSEGNIGLLLALRRYEPSRGAFIPFARERIAGQIRDYLRSLDPLTRYQREGGVLPAPVMCPEELLATVAGGSRECPERILWASNVRRAVVTVLAPRQQYLVREYYWRDRTLRSIAADLGVNEPRVNQIRSAALLKMARSASFRGLGKAA